MPTGKISGKTVNLRDKGGTGQAAAYGKLIADHVKAWESVGLI